MDKILSDKMGHDMEALVWETAEELDKKLAERSFLARVEGGCQVPVGVYAQVEDDDNLSVEAVIGSIDGKCIIRDKIIGSRANAKTLGKDLAEKLLANGGLKIMQSLGLCCPDENAQ